MIFGPGGEGAHAVVEWVDLASVERCAEVLLAAAGEFCGEEPTTGTGVAVRAAG